MTAAATAAETKSPLVRDLSNREQLQKRVDELDGELLAHHRKAAAQQSQWREEEAALLRERNATLQQISEL